MYYIDKAEGLTSTKWWLVGFACRNRNDHQPPGLSYISDTALF